MKLWSPLPHFHRCTVLLVFFNIGEVYDGQQLSFSPALSCCQDGYGRGHDVFSLSIRLPVCSCWLYIHYDKISQRQWRERDDKVPTLFFFSPPKVKSHIRRSYATLPVITRSSQERLLAYFTSWSELNWSHSFGFHSYTQTHSCRKHTHTMAMAMGCPLSLALALSFLPLCTTLLGLISASCNKVASKAEMHGSFDQRRDCKVQHLSAESERRSIHLQFRLIWRLHFFVALSSCTLDISQVSSSSWFWTRRCVQPSEQHLLNQSIHCQYRPYHIPTCQHLNTSSILPQFF